MGEGTWRSCRTKNFAIALPKAQILSQQYLAIKWHIDLAEGLIKSSLDI